MLHPIDLSTSILNVKCFWNMILNIFVIMNDNFEYDIDVNIAPMSLAR